jgi:hypothetical protein
MRSSPITPRVLAQNIDDAHPNYRWIWERLAGAMVPGIDPWVGVHQRGIVRVTVENTETAASKVRSTEVEIAHGRRRIPLSTPPSRLEELTLFGVFSIRVRGNRPGAIVAVNSGDDVNFTTFEINGTTVNLERGQNPGANFDSTGCATSVGVRHTVVASIKSGDQSYYIDGALGAQWTQTPTFSWADPFVYYGSTDASLEQYTNHYLCGALEGISSAAEVRRLTDVFQTLDPFVYERRRTYSIPRTSAASPPIIMVAHASTTGNTIGITTPKVGNTLIASWRRPNTTTTGMTPSGGGVSWTEVMQYNGYAYTSMFVGHNADGLSSSVSVPAGCTELGVTEFSGLAYSTASFDTARNDLDGVGGARMYCPTASLSSSIQVPYLMYIAVSAANVAPTGPSENFIALPSRVNTFDYLYRIGLSNTVAQYYGTVYSHGGGNVQYIAATFPGSISTDVDYVKAPLTGSADVLKVGLAAPVGVPSAGTVKMVIRHRRT